MSIERRQVHDLKHVGLNPIPATTIKERMVLMFEKIEALKVAHQRFNPKTWADMGGVWGVNGGYSQVIWLRYNPDRVVLCDYRSVTDERLQGCGVELVQANFLESVDQIGEVDAMVFFDVLLRQQDWKGLLEAYSKAVKLFVVFQPTSREPIDLTGMDLDQYLGLVPEGTREYVQKCGKDMNAIKGDVGAWQWGISTGELEVAMSDLGFEMAYRRDHGRFMDGLPYHNVATVFAKKEIMGW